MDSENSYPRLFGEVINTGLCTGCGTCIGLSDGKLRYNPFTGIPEVIPPGQLHGLSGAPVVELPEIAYQACPGKGLNYPSLNQFLFHKIPENWLIGNYLNTWIGYSSNETIRRNGASGGVITQVLIELLRSERVDGVVTIRQQKDQPWKVDPVIIRKPDEVTASAQSIYFPVPVNAILKEFKEGETYAYVGLPDQVASIRRLQQLGYAPAKQIRYILGPYVGINMTIHAIVSFLTSNGIAGLNDVSSLKFRDGEWPGYLKITTHSGKVITAKKFYYNYLLPFFLTRHSLLSVDFSNELCDISVGDAWSPKYEKEGKGFSVVIVRSETGGAILEEIMARNLPGTPDGSPLTLSEIPVSEALDMHGHMFDFKKRGAFIRIGWRKFFGKRVPEYGYRPVSIPVSRKLVEVVISGVFFAGSWRVSKWFISLIPVSVSGPVFDTLRKSWKSVSRPTKRKDLGNTCFITSD